MNDGNHVNDLLPAYALDILTEEETAQVAEHLVTCAVCRAEFRQYQSVVDDLPLALAQTPPAPIVKDRLMKSLHTRQTQAVSVSPRSGWQTIWAFLRRSYPAWSLALIVLLALGNIFLFQRVQQYSGKTTPQPRSIALTNTQDSPNASGILVLNPSGEYGALVVDGLLPLDNWHQYQIWLNRDDERVSGGVFSVNWSGYATLEISAPRPLIQYQTVGITIEPAGGSPGPTGAKVLGGALQP